MNDISQAFLLHSVDLAKAQVYRVELPEFPLSWLDKSKRNIEGLREIASHLHGKTEAGRTSRTGFKGVATTEMEKQLIDKVINLEQQVFVVTDVLQCAIQMVVSQHESKITQRIKRAGIRVWTKAASLGNRLWESTIFKVLGGASTIAFLCSALIWTMHRFGWL